MSLIDKFNERFNVSGSLRKTELETQICKQFSDLQYWCFPEVDLPDQHISGGFYCGCSSDWGTNTIQTANSYNSLEEALIGLILEQTEENQPRQPYDETPFSNKTEFEELVRRVYDI